MGSDFRLGVVTALWRRPAITAVCLRHWARLSVPGVALSLVAARSPATGPGGDPEASADVPGWTYTEAPNSPLSDKWNGAARALRGKVDGVLVTGSDDLIDADYIERATRRIRERAAFVYASRCVFVDTETGRARWGYPARQGVGRVLSASLLDALDWRPWPEGLDRRLDSGMDRRVRALPVESRREKRVAVGLCVDLKSAVNMWSYDDLDRISGSEIDGHRFLQTHFPQAYDDLVTSHILSL